MKKKSLHFGPNPCILDPCLFGGQKTPSKTQNAGIWGKNAGIWGKKAGICFFPCILDLDPCLFLAIPAFFVKRQGLEGQGILRYPCVSSRLKAPSLCFRDMSCSKAARAGSGTFQGSPRAGTPTTQGGGPARGSAQHRSSRGTAQGGSRVTPPSIGGVTCEDSVSTLQASACAMWKP